MTLSPRTRTWLTVGGLVTAVAGAVVMTKTLASNASTLPWRTAIPIAFDPVPPGDSLRWRQSLYGDTLGHWRGTFEGETAMTVWPVVPCAVATAMPGYVRVLRGGPPLCHAIVCEWDSSWTVNTHNAWHPEKSQACKYRYGPVSTLSDSAACVAEMIARDVDNLPCAKRWAWNGESHSKTLPGGFIP